MQNRRRAASVIGLAAIVTLANCSRQHAGSENEDSVTTSLTSADAHDARTTADKPIPDVVYIDPARFLPESLAQPIDLELTEVTLEYAMQVISDRSGVPVQIDSEQLDNEGVTIEEPVTLKSEGVPLYLVLETLFDNVAGVRLRWVMESGVLRVTTESDPDSQMVTNAYNLRDLLERSVSTEEVINTIPHFCDGEWFGVKASDGTWAMFGDTMVVHHTARAHRVLSALLEAIRADARERRVGEPLIHAELEQRIDQIVDVGFPYTTFSDVVDAFNQDYDIHLRFDIEEMQNEGITPDEDVRFPQAELPLRTVLRLMLKDVAGVELRAVIHNGVILITSLDRADELTPVRIYDVSDLTAADGRRMGSLITIARELAEAARSDTDVPIGRIDSLDDQLIVRHTERGHERIRELLKSLRANAAESREIDPKRDNDAGSERAIETRYYRLDPQTAEDLLMAIPDLVAPGTWKSTQNRTGELVTLNSDGIGIIRCVRAGQANLDVSEQDDSPSTAEDAQGPEPEVEEGDEFDKSDDAAPESIAGQQSILIVTHRWLVHRELIKLLRELNAIEPGETFKRDLRPEFIEPPKKPGRGFYHGFG